MSINSLSQSGGTCYFIKKNNRTFLVTAKHVITRTNIACGEKTINTMTIAILDTLQDGNIDSFITIRIPPLNSYNSSDSINNPDVIVFEVKEKGIDRLKSVENFIMPELRYTNNTEIFGFNSVCFPHEFGRLIIKCASHVHIDSTNTIFYNGSPTNNNIPDTAYYMLVNKNLDVSEYMHGFSGSPIFIKDLNTNRYRLIGTFSIFGGDSVNKDLKFYQIPKIEYITNEINRLSQ